MSTITSSQGRRTTFWQSSGREIGYIGRERPRTSREFVRSCSAASLSCTVVVVNTTAYVTE